MIPWAQVHLRAAAEALRAQRDLNVDATRPVDPFGALINGGVTVMRRPLDRLAGAYLGTLGSSSPGVLVNSSHPLAKQRYTAAHEMGHHRLDGQSVIDWQTEWMDDGVAPIDDRERLAEAFAAWFLMPRTLVHRAMVERGVTARTITPVVAYELALLLGVSYRALVNHLGDLRILPSPRRAELLHQRPRDIKAGILGGADVGDLHRDVIRVPQGATEAVATTGDLVVVEVPEVPSTGFRWAVTVPESVSVLDSRFVPERAPEVLGASGIRRIVARLDEPARSEMSLTLSRPWSTESAADSVKIGLLAEPKPRPGLVSPERVLATSA